MQIDWITLIAQIINFLLLLFLLKHFLFDKIVAAMRKRQQKIDDRLQDAKSTKEEAEEQLQEYKNMKEELEDRKEKIIQTAEKEARDKKEQLLDDARQEIDRVSEKWKAAVEQEKEAFIKSLRLQVGNEIYETARRVLKDLADEEIESAITNKFIEKLAHLSDADKKQIKEHYPDSGNLIVRSHYKLNQNQQKKLNQTLKKNLDLNPKIDFKVTDELIGGIELLVNGYKVVWSIDEHTLNLQNKFDQYFEQ